MVLTDEELEQPPLDEPRELADSTLCLVHDDGYSDRLKICARDYIAPERGWWVQGDAQFEYLNLFCAHTWICRFQKDDRSLRLESKDSLLGHVVAIGISRFGMGKPGRNRFDFLRYPIDIDPTPQALAACRTGFFSGLWEVCSCGQPADSSSYAWIWGEVLLLYLEYVGGPGICSITLFPAELPDTEVETRRRRRAELLAKRQASQ